MSKCQIQINPSRRIILVGGTGSLSGRVQAHIPVTFGYRAEAGASTKLLRARLIKSDAVLLEALGISERATGPRAPSSTDGF